MNTNGAAMIRRHPELRTVTLEVADEGPDKDAVIDNVAKAAAELAELLEALAPPKTGVQVLAVEEDVCDPDFMITRWSMPDMRTWSRDERNDEVAGRRGKREGDKSAVELTQHASQSASATFHDIEGM